MCFNICSAINRTAVWSILRRSSSPLNMIRPVSAEALFLHPISFPLLAMNDNGLGSKQCSERKGGNAIFLKLPGDSNSG